MDRKYHRDKANECCREAEIATDINDKAAWLEIASIWMRLLAQISQNGSAQALTPPDSKTPIFREVAWMGHGRPVDVERMAQSNCRCVSSSSQCGKIDPA